MRSKHSIPPFLVLFLLTAGAFAAEGVVVYNRSCDYFIVETKRGYALLEWYGGYDPSEGNGVVGDFERYGFKDIYNMKNELAIHDTQVLLAPACGLR